MVLFRVEHMYLNGVIPFGKRLYFCCPGCGKMIKVRSLWRNLLGVPGCLLFAIFAVLFVSFLAEGALEPASWTGILTAICAYFPFVLVSECVTRARYPKRAGDWATGRPARNA